MVIIVTTYPKPSRHHRDIPATSVGPSFFLWNISVYLPGNCYKSASLMLYTCSFRPRQIRERNFTSIPMPALWKFGFDIQYNFEDLQRWYCSNAPIHLSGRTCSILSWNKLSSNLRAKAEEVVKKLQDDNEGWPEICFLSVCHLSWVCCTRWTHR